MSLNLRPVTISYIKKYLPVCFWDNTVYFSINKNDNYCGIYSITDWGNGIGEVFLMIYSNHSLKTLSRTLLKCLIDLPSLIGFKEIWTRASTNSGFKLLSRFESDGVYLQNSVPYWENDLLTKWFRKVY